MRNFLVALIRRRCIINHQMAALSTRQNQTKEASSRRTHDRNNYKQEVYFLTRYTKQRIHWNRSPSPSGSNSVTLSDIESQLHSCQSCVEISKSILDQHSQLSLKQREVLDAIQMNIWENHALEIDFEQLLDLIEKGVLQEYYSEYLVRALYMRATEKFDTYNWDAASITRLMLITTIFRQVPLTLLKKVHTFVCLNIKLFSLKELSLVMNAFYVARFNYGHADFLALTVIDKTLDGLPDMNSADLFMIIKACQSRISNNVPFLLDIATELTKNEEVLKKHCRNFIDVAYFLKQYAKFKLNVPKFVKAVVKVMPKPTDFKAIPYGQKGKICLKNANSSFFIRMKDIGTISWALGCLAYDPKDFTGIHTYLENLFVAVTSLHGYTSHTHIREFFFGQIMAGRFSPVFIEYMQVYSSKHLKENVYEKSEKRSMLAILLRVSIDIERPEVQLEDIPRGLLESNMKANVFKTTYTSTFIDEVADYMNEMLGGRLIHSHVILPYIVKVLEIRLDNNDRPIPFTPTDYDDLLEEMKNEQVMLRSGRRIAIVLRSKSSFLRSDQKYDSHDHPSGFTMISRRHLQKLGYESCLLSDSPKTASGLAERTMKQLVEKFRVKVNSAARRQR
ncbi:uncharacterized protein [Argopecten irradians]|uniref:uncharacterized protein isoform X2 n=1 Tax=Argopecten irradians TaxID=31199 RepID=UPI003717F282